MPSGASGVDRRGSPASGGGSISEKRLQPAGRVLRQQQPHGHAAPFAPTSYRPATACTSYMPLQARPASTPKTAATAGRPTALDLFARPGSCEVDRPGARRAGRRRRRRTAPSRHRTAGRTRTRRRTSRRRALQQVRTAATGRTTRRPSTRCPAATQMTFGASEAAQTISGSSALATNDSQEPARRFPPVPGEHPDLGGPVHLVAGEVQQREHAGVG